MNMQTLRLALCATLATVWLPLATAGTPSVSAEASSDSAANDKSAEHSGKLTVHVDDDVVVTNDVEKAKEALEQATDDAENAERHHHHHHGDNARVHIGSDVSLGADETASAVVAVFGSASSAGTVDESVVSVFGDTHVTGSTGESAVTVFGSTYIDGHVNGDAVAVFGDLELGPNAVVEGDTTVVGGVIKRAPTAILRHGPNEVSLGIFGKATGFRVWIEKCLLYVRPLAFAPGLGWAWAVAFAFLALYALIAFMFERSVRECVETLETRPGASFGTALLTVLITPFLFVLLCVTVVGIALIPFLVLAMLGGMIFGKAIVFAAIGRRFTRFVPNGPMTHVAAATVLGGLIAMILYCVPVLGFVLFKVFGLLGLGVVIYTIILASQARKASRTPPSSAAGVEGIAAEGTGESTSTADSSTAHTAAAQPAITLPRANFWIRMAALFIDAVLIAVIVNVANIEDAWLLVLATYAAIMWKLKGTTVGGIICNLRLARLDGREIDWSTAIVRALSCFLSLAFLFLGFFWIAFDREHQGWHDKIAGTIVVRTPRGGSLV